MQLIRDAAVIAALQSAYERRLVALRLHVDILKVRAGEAVAVASAASHSQFPAIPLQRTHDSVQWSASLWSAVRLSCSCRRYVPAPLFHRSRRRSGCRLCLGVTGRSCECTTRTRRTQGACSMLPSLPPPSPICIHTCGASAACLAASPHTLARPVRGHALHSRGNASFDDRASAFSSREKRHSASERRMTQLAEEITHAWDADDEISYSQDATLLRSVNRDLVREVRSQ